MKEIFWPYIRFRMNSTILFYVGAILILTARVVLQTFSFPFPLTMMFVSPYITFNGTAQSTETHTDGRVEQVQLTPAPTVISLNSCHQPIQSALKLRKKIKHSEEPPQLPPTPLQRYVWSLSPGEALLYAKKEMQRAPIVTRDSNLHAPLFHNVSIFKSLWKISSLQKWMQCENVNMMLKVMNDLRTYELMELILKVYVYPDGKKPIFHKPHLSGIYASEGWFLKLMEENKQFLTRNPEKAHLFFLPYSARQLELALYTPGSHDLRPLNLFMRNYTNTLTSKYSFWNRTRGWDHFLVACHDWGPYTLTLHQELKKNTIKALCNADRSEGIFRPGKDVSLPETLIRNPRIPQRNVGGGIRVSQRSILAFFAGHMHGRIRPELLKYWSDKDEDMRIYGLLPRRVSRNMSYIQHMRSSKYCLCPMGHEVNSPRIVEAIYYECVPVIIADNFVLPLSDVLNWSTFSVVVAEKDIPRLKEILLAIPLRKYLRMLHNLKMLQKHFLWNQRPVRYDLFHMILHSIWFSRLSHVQIPDS